jgi:amino acid transporter
MARNKQAPAIFARTTRLGVPYVAVLFTWAVACLAYLNVSNNGATVFTWFTNISTISGFIAWIVIMITYLRFRSAMKYNGMLRTLPFRTPLQPYATYASLLIIVILTLTNGFQVFFPSQWSASSFLAAYITLPTFIVLYLGHKIWFRTTFARPVTSIDVMTGKREMDEMEAMDEPPVATNWLQKIWFWLA